MVRLLLPLVPVWHRAYFRSHRLGVNVAVGVFFSGLLNLFLPAVTDTSAAALVLPAPLLTAFNLTWVVGGAMSVFGLVKGSVRAEVPGSALIAGGLTAYFVVVASIRSWAALAAIFIAFLALGYAERAWQLWRCGYDHEVRGG